LLFIITEQNKWEVVAILVFLFLILFLKHRGLAHEPLLAIVVAGFFAYIFGGNLIVGLYAGIGFISHLVADRREPD